MSKRTKGLSFEEKRTRLAEFFYETKDFWQLKDVEKLASKSKGIVTQTIKDVLDSLVSDNIVTVEKIGTSNYYWSFPSTAVQTRKRKIEELEEELEKYRSKKRDMEATMAERRDGREETDERTTLLADLASAEALKKANRAELERYKDCDPALLEAKEKATKIAKAAANRWTDNIFAIQTYCSRQFGMPGQQFAEQFQIPDTFDNL